MLFFKHTKAHNRWSFTSNRKYLNSCGRSPKWRTCSSRRMEPLIMDSQNYTLENQRGTQSWRFGIWFSFSTGWLLGEPCSFSGVSYFFRYRIWRSPVTFIPYHLIKKRYTDIIWYVYIYIYIHSCQLPLRPKLFFSWEDAIGKKHLGDVFAGCFHLTSSHTFTYPPCSLRRKSRYKGWSLDHLGVGWQGCLVERAEKKPLGMQLAREIHLKISHSRANSAWNRIIISSTR